MQVRFTDLKIWITVAISLMAISLGFYTLFILIDFVITYWYIVVAVLGVIGILLYLYSQRE